MQELEVLMEAERSHRWARTPAPELADRLLEVAEAFYTRGDALALETAERMGVSPASVWFESLFPAVWGLLSTASFLKPLEGSLDEIVASEPIATQDFAGSPALRLLPANSFQRLLLPGFSGHVLLRPSVSAPPRQPSTEGLALCLLPFNLAGIGVLDILHLLCLGPRRVLAKVSEKASFLKDHLEKAFAPLVSCGALSFVQGGPDTGARLAARPEFDRIHLTGSARTAAAVQAIAGQDKVTCELGGVTPAIVLPEVGKDRRLLRQVARQVVFGALANNGQHCVSYQVVLVPESLRTALGQALAREMALVSGPAGPAGPDRLLIDEAASSRVAAMVEDARGRGATVTSFGERSSGRRFPVTLLSGITDEMRLFREEAFGPVVGLASLPDRDFSREALSRANRPALAGDLGASVFTPFPDSEPVRHLARHLKHGVVAINSYPGVAYATSLPWGPGPGQASGRGWVHNFRFLDETRMEKVVLAATLGRKGLGPVAWEDPWLPNVGGRRPLRLAKALVRSALAWFRKQPGRLLASQWDLVPALIGREVSARRQDRLPENHLFCR
ncbi:MAG: aldehyde dehydrogenase family protein [Acidobacteria bacterium]|nr:aldehyde dehydrogenase family protein [Acidobacteriota bacterium]